MKKKGSGAGVMHQLNNTTKSHDTQHRSYAIYRVSSDGMRQIVAYVDSTLEIGVEIDADREKLDWEPMYEVIRE